MTTINVKVKKSFDSGWLKIFAKQLYFFETHFEDDGKEFGFLISLIFLSEIKIIVKTHILSIFHW